MNTHTMMSREEMFELAALDAYGLLDGFESELYTRSYHHAPAAVQDEIAQFQAELASDQTLLPLEDPPTALRQRVLTAVARAIQRQHSELAPLAIIGRRRRESDVSGRFHVRYAVPLWRAAVFMLLGMVAVLVFFWADARKVNTSITEYALDSNTRVQLEQIIGPTVKDYLFNPSAQHVLLVDSSVASSPLRARLMVDEQTQSAFLVYNNLPQPREDESPYTLALVEASGEVREIKTFATSGGLGGLQISLKNLSVSVASKWRITGPRGILLASI